MRIETPEERAWAIVQCREIPRIINETDSEEECDRLRVERADLQRAIRDYDHRLEELDRRHCVRLAIEESVCWIDYSSDDSSIESFIDRIEEIYER